MDPSNGEKSFNLEVSLYDLLLLMTAVESHVERLNKLHGLLMSQMSKNLSIPRAPVPENGDPVSDLMKGLERARDGTGAETRGSKTLNAGMENPFIRLPAESQEPDND